MKKIILAMTGLLAMSWLFPVNLPAKDGALKIATVDSKRIFREFNGSKDAKKVLASSAQAMEDELRKRQDELTKLQKSYNEKKLLLTEDVKAKKEQEIIKKLQEMQDLKAKYQKDLSDKEEELTEQINVKARAVAKTIAEAKGYDLVLEKTYVLHGGEDITDEVLKGMEQQEKDSKK